MKRIAKVILTPVVVFIMFLLTAFLFTGLASAKADFTEEEGLVPVEVEFECYERRDYYAIYPYAQITEEGTIYDISVKPTAIFHLRVTLPEFIPIPENAEIGDSEIMLSVFSYDDNEDISEELLFTDWLTIENTEFKDGRITITIFVDVPEEMPDGVYQFSVTTEGLEPPFNNTIFSIEIDHDLT